MSNDMPSESEEAQVEKKSSAEKEVDLDPEKNRRESQIAELGSMLAGEAAAASSPEKIESAAKQLAELIRQRNPVYRERLEESRLANLFRDSDKCQIRLTSVNGSPVRLALTPDGSVIIETSLNTQDTASEDSGSYHGLYGGENKHSVLDKAAAVEILNEEIQRNPENATAATRLIGKIQNFVVGKTYFE